MIDALMIWLNANQGTATLLTAIVGACATVVLTITTMVYAWHTWQLAKENRLLRKAGTDPQVIAYATINPNVYGAIDFVLANVGKGPARNILFDIVSGGDDFAAHDVRISCQKVRFAILPQDEQIRTLIGMGHSLLAEPKLNPFEVKITYDGQSKSEKFLIDISQFEGLTRVGKPPIEEIADEMKKIAKVMGDWSRKSFAD